MRLSATAVLDGWPSARASGCTEPGLQASSPAARKLTCWFVVMDAPVPFRFRQYGLQDLVDGGAAKVVSVREQVPVGVHRLGESRVAQPGLDDLRVEVRGDERARVEMPQVVESGPGRELVRGVGAGAAVALPLGCLRVAGRESPQVHPRAASPSARIIAGHQGWFETLRLYRDSALAGVSGEVGEEK